MVHAGWRGLAAGVLAEGVAALRDVGATGPGQRRDRPRCRRAAATRSATRCARRSPTCPRRCHGRNVDLKAVATARLRAAGVEEIHDAGLCTMCDARFFSHRRDRGTTGRQGGIAWLT